MIGNDFGSTETVGLMMSAEYSITGGSGLEGGGGTPLLVRFRSSAPPPRCGRRGWDRLPPSIPVPDFAWFFSVFMRMVGKRSLTSFKGAGSGIATTPDSGIEMLRRLTSETTTKTDA